MSHAYVVRPKVDKAEKQKNPLLWCPGNIRGKYRSNNWLRISLPGAHFQEEKYWLP